MEKQVTEITITLDDLLEPEIEEIEVERELSVLIMDIVEVSSLPEGECSNVRIIAVVYCVTCGRPECKIDPGVRYIVEKY